MNIPTNEDKHNKTKIKLAKVLCPCKRMPSKDRKAQILTATRELIFAEGTSKFTLKRIAKNIGITEAAVYRHFPTKEELMLSLLSSMFTPWKKALEKLVNDKTPDQYKLLLVGKIHLHYLLNAKVNPLLFFSDALNPDQTRLKNELMQNLGFVNQTIKTILQQGANKGIFDKNINLDDIQRCILGTLQYAVIKWTIYGTETMLFEEVQQTLTTLLTSIGTDLSQQGKYLKNSGRFTK